MSKRKCDKCRTGYVLLMTILLIAISGLLMAGIARYSLRLVSESLAAQSELQRRWGAMSCRRAVLAHADAILRRQSVANRKSRGEPSPGVTVASTQVALGNVAFDIVVADENAKISLNTIQREKGKEGVGQLIQEMTQQHGSFQVHLRPYRTEGNAAQSIAYDSWGQVFFLNADPDTVPPAALLPTSTIDITCWGDGKLNLERASDDIVSQVAATVVDESAVQRLLDFRKQYFTQLAEIEALEEEQKVQGRNKNPNVAKQITDRKKQMKNWLNDLTAGLGLRSNERSQLRGLITDHSNCCSLWLTMCTEQRSWRQFCIRSYTSGSQSKERVFCW